MSATLMTEPAAGWYHDPADAGAWRWWDGATWTDHVRPTAEAAPLTTGPASRIEPVPTHAPGLRAHRLGRACRRSRQPVADRRVTVDPRAIPQPGQVAPARAGGPATGGGLCRSPRRPRSATRCTGTPLPPRSIEVPAPEPRVHRRHRDAAHGRSAPELRPRLERPRVAEHAGHLAARASRRSSASVIFVRASASSMGMAGTERPRSRVHRRRRRRPAAHWIFAAMDARALTMRGYHAPPSGMDAAASRPSPTSSPAARRCAARASGLAAGAGLHPLPGRDGAAVGVRCPPQSRRARASLARLGGTVSLSVLLSPAPGLVPGPGGSRPPTAGGTATPGPRERHGEAPVDVLGVVGPMAPARTRLP